VPLPKYPIRKTTMQSLNRASVELDMCPTYPGAWLDCGELRHCVGRFIASTGFSMALVSAQSRQVLKLAWGPRKPPARAASGLQSF
jgi:Zn-finger nucleic acid-binding protein